MINYNELSSDQFDAVKVDPYWNVGDKKEDKMHRIHAYPAKFPAFITNKVIDLAKRKGKKINCVADVFCGCGTAAYESYRSEIDFWGCDINPVATLIAKVKSRKYQPKRLESYLRSILSSYKKSKIQNMHGLANERLKYWYTRKQYNELYQLKKSIERMTPANSNYRLFFICAFSNILKPTSKWLTKSIKPQVDPEKKAANVLQCFIDQCDFMISANNQNSHTCNADVDIVTNNILDKSVVKPLVDLIVTSPPYVTSYEYADLHQLSSLWLGYTDDYTKLREGTIGSIHHMYNFDKELKRLNETGSKIVYQLIDQHHRKAKSVAKYFHDMQKTAIVCHSMLKKNGIAAFVIGNTEYKSVKIRNAEHLAESLKNAGFKQIEVTKRKISNKILTPYRDKNGRFTSDGSGRKIYSDEFIIIGYK